MAEEKITKKTKKTSEKIVVGDQKINLSTKQTKSSPLRHMHEQEPDFDNQVTSHHEQEKSVEEKVFNEIEGSIDIEMPPIFQRFLRDLAPKYFIGRTSFDTLSAFYNLDVNAERVASCLKNNQYYQHHLLKVIHSLTQREELPGVDSAVVLMGMQNTRNLLVALQVSRCFKRVHPKWDDKGRIILEPAEILHYATQTEEMLTARKDGSSHIGFVSGLVFDIAILLSNEFSENPQRVNDYINNLYDEGLKSAFVGMELAKNISNFSYTKYVFSACLIHNIGKAMMAILDPSYLSFVDQFKKEESPRFIRHYMEKRRYQINHNVLSSVICHYFDVLRPISKGVYFHHEPFLLKKDKKEVYLFAGLVCLASNIASHYKLPESTGDPLIKKWMGHELGDFPLRVSTIITIMRKLLLNIT